MSSTTGRRLVIVESPAKAKTIAGYLGKDYDVEASVGHIRDLPNPSELPAEMKKAPYGKFAVDVDNGFEAYYVVDPDKKKKVAELKRLLKDADQLLLATDEDREGEAIAWHLLEVLKPKVPVRRMVFHEITKQAIERALQETRDIDDRLVDAQETRRVVERGRERIQFRAAEYWDIVATFDPGEFDARLTAVDGKKVAQGRDFARNGTLLTADAVQLDEEDARGLAEALEGVLFTVRSVERKPYTRRPAAPFMTSTLQQEASRKLRFSAQHP